MDIKFLFMSAYHELRLDGGEVLRREGCGDVTPVIEGRSVEAQNGDVGAVAEGVSTAGDGEREHRRGGAAPHKLTNH